MRDENLEINQHMEIRLPFMKCFLTLSLPKCLIEFCEVTLTFEFVNEIL